MPLDKKVFDMTDKELVEHSFTAQHLRNQCPIEINRRLKNKIINLKKSIDNFNQTSSEESNSMIKLTKRILWLTILMGILALSQLSMLVYQIFWM